MSLDISLCLLNREHYSKNIVKEKKRIVFSSCDRCQGYNDIISIADLLRYPLLNIMKLLYPLLLSSFRPRYTDSNGEFLIELTLSRLRTTVEKDFLIQPKFLDKNLSNLQLVHENTLSSGQFSFGSFVWSIILSGDPLLDNVKIHLVRDHSDNKSYSNKMLARIRYRKL